MGSDSYEPYSIAHAATVLLTWFATVVLFLCTFCMVRRRRDPARTGFTYLKAAFAIFAAFLFFDVCAYALAISISRWYKDYHHSPSDEDISKSLRLAGVHTWAVVSILSRLADISVFFVLERLATGVMIAKTGAPDKIGTLLKYASYAIAIVLAALSFAGFGLIERYNISNDSDDFFDETLPASVIKSIQIYFSFRVLVFVLSLAIVGRSVMVRMQSRGEPRVINASNFVLAASVLWLLHCVYNMAAFASNVDLSNGRTNANGEKPYWDILVVVFEIWPQFNLLCLVFWLGLKKGNGLWSTQEVRPTKVLSGPQQTPWGYGYDQAQLQDVPQPFQQPVQNEWQNQEPQYPQQYQQPVNAPQQHQNGYQQPYQGSQPVSSYSTTPAQTRPPPPPHEDTIGLNHQADGTPPQAQSQPYNEKTTY